MENTQNTQKFSVKKIMTLIEGVMFICFVENKKPIFFYMKKNGERFISFGEIKKRYPFVPSQEWGWAKEEWKKPVERATLEESQKAFKLVKELKKNSFFGFKEKDHQAKADFMARKIEKAFKERIAIEKRLIKNTEVKVV